MIPINLEYKDVNVSDEQKEHFKHMFQDTDRYNDMAVNADLYLKSLSDSSSDDMEVSIRMNMPGKDIFISKQAESLGAAASEVYDALKVALRRHKEQHKEIHRPNVK